MDNDLPEQGIEREHRPLKIRVPVGKRGAFMVLVSMERISNEVAPEVPFVSRGSRPEVSNLRTRFFLSLHQPHWCSVQSRTRAYSTRTASSSESNSR